MSDTKCPDESTLRWWLEGDADESEAGVIADHVNACDACQTRLDGLMREAPLVGPAATDRVEYRPAPGVLTDLKRPGGTVRWDGAAGLTHPLDGDEPVPDIPGYADLERLAGGGMGVVYRARHVGLNRTVALKVMRRGLAARAADRERFRREAEAMARFNHDRIVRVYEVGEHAGVPYFAMEYVPGGTLARRIGRRPLPPREAAALAAQIAYGLDHAHQGGVIHRDLKPANVLLAGDAGPGSGGSTRDARRGSAGTPANTPTGEDTPSAESGLPTAKITDFGLARQLDGTPGQTIPGVVLGTPSYMAPEQARGENEHVGPAADVYALGAVLYEMLTGRPPFEAPTAEQTRRLVAGDEDPPPVRALQPGVDRDLETICLKCLQKDPARRYPTAEAVGRDLDNWLAGRPIVARPAGPVERLWKVMRRNRGVSALLGLLVLAIAGGFAGVLWQLGRVKDRENQVRQEKETAVLHSQRAVANEQKSNAYFLVANGVIDELLVNDGGEERLEAPAVAGRLRGVPGSNPVRRAFLDKAEAAYEQLLAIESDPGSSEARTARNRAMRTLATIFENQAVYLEVEGNSRAAADRRDRALELRKQLIDTEPDVPDNRYGLARSHLRDGITLRKRGPADRARAEDFLRSVIAAADRLVTEDPRKGEYLHLRARGWVNLGDIHHATRRPDEATRAYAQATANLERLADLAPHVFLYRHDQAAVLSLIADRSAPPDKEPAHRRAVAAWEGVVKAFPDQPDARDELSTRLYVLGAWYRDNGRAADWEAAWKESVRVSEELVRDHPDVFRYTANLATACYNLGARMSEKGEHAESVRLSGRAIALLEKSPDGPGRIRQHADPVWFYRYALANRAWELTELGKYDEAVRDWDRAVELVTAEDRVEFALGRAETLLRKGDRTAAVTAVTAVERVVPGARGAGMIGAARVLALAIASANSDATLSEVARGPLVEVYAARAVGLLNAAADAGLFKDAAALKGHQEDKVWEPLRGRPDYQAFLARVSPPGKP